MYIYILHYMNVCMYIHVSIYIYTLIHLFIYAHRDTCPRSFCEHADHVFTHACKVRQSIDVHTFVSLCVGTLLIYPIDTCTCQKLLAKESP